MKYCILIANSAFDLEKLVGEMLEKGWKPIGGVSVNKHNTYLQAIIYE
jgi:hypothetical protein